MYFNVACCFVFYNFDDNNRNNRYNYKKTINLINDMLSIIATVLFLISCGMSFTDIIRMRKGKSQLFPASITWGLILVGWICFIISMTL